MPERLVLQLEATADCAFDPDFNYKFMGRVYQALNDTNLDNVHDSDAPAPFTFSNPRPHGDLEAGDERQLIVSSPHGRDLYDLLITDLSADPELNLGHMCFRVTDAHTVEISVGPPGSTGTIRTPTGVFQRLSHDVCERHDIDPPTEEESLYWSPQDHPPLALLEQLRRNLGEKLRAYHPDTIPNPDPTEDRLFTSYDLRDAGAMQKTVTTNQTITLLYSKWEFDYEVRDEQHRRWLNTLLGCGIGARCGLGFGYCHITDQTVHDNAAEPSLQQPDTPSQQNHIDDADGRVPCPFCDRSFETQHGMRTHHTKVHDESLVEETRVCPNCRDDFEVPHWKEKKFCSQSCSNKFRGEEKRETRSCAWCGLSLETWPSWDTEYHQECYFEATADRDRPGELAELARVLYANEERAIREAWRLARGHGYDVTKDEFRALLEELDILRTPLARQLESGEIDLDAEYA